jgi:acyl-CoA thioesterase FadM
VTFWIRIAWTALTAALEPRVGPLDEVRTRHRAWLSDCDPNFHLNDGRYLSVSGLSRLALWVRMGLLPRFLRDGWRPAAGGSVVAYYRPIPPWARYEITSRLLTWDDKYFVFEHTFECSGRIHARILVRSLFLGPDGKLAPSQVLAALGHHDAAPPSPAEVEHWAAMRAAGPAGARGGPGAPPRRR